MATLRLYGGATAGARIARPVTSLSLVDRLLPGFAVYRLGPCRALHARRCDGPHQEWHPRVHAHEIRSDAVRLDRAIIFESLDDGMYYRKRRVYISRNG